MYEASDVLSIVGSIGILVTALGAVIVNIIVAMKTGKKLETSLANQVGMSNQIKEVHTLTNSNLSLVKAELDKANLQIEEMKTFIRDLKGERDKTAHNLPAAIAIPDLLKVKEVLDSIDKNTDNIDKNTKVLQTAIDKNTVVTENNTQKIKEKK